MPCYKLVAFDMDGVLVDMESSWRYAHKHLGTDNSMARRAYLKGDMGSYEFMNTDIALWRSKGKTLRDIEAIFEDVPVMKGAHKCIDELKKKDITTAIVSGGLGILAKRIAENIGMDYAIANGIKENMEGGILNVSPRNKGTALVKLAEDLGIKKEEIVSVGNSRYDVKMFEVSGRGIAFNPCDDEVVEYADIIIKEKNLSLILPYISE